MPEKTWDSRKIDIDKQRLGAVYAKALLGAAESPQAVESILGELEWLIDDAFAAHPALEQVFASPRIASADKLQMMDRLFADRMSPELLTFLKVVCRHGRLDCLREIRTAARQELNRLQGRVEVQITTTQPISDQLRERIVQVLKESVQADVSLQCVQDEEILGGLVVRVGDRVFDGSIRNQLQRLREETLEKTFRELRESTERFATSE